MVLRDFGTIKDLYDFTEEALKLSGTGRLEDLEKWLSANYSERFRHLFQDPRPWVRNTLGQPALRPCINLVPVNAPVPKHTPRPKRDKKGRLASVLLYNPHCLVLCRSRAVHGWFDSPQMIDVNCLLEYQQWMCRVMVLLPTA